MRTIIEQKLKEIEQKENVVILYAVESGSRAWGFASTNSDYDVRFIYIRNPEHYWKLEKTKDVIEWQLDETLDINGWDLQKALRLLHRSNATLFEWLSSPIVYRTCDIWEEIRPQMMQCFLAKTGQYQYLHTAQKQYDRYLTGESVKLKKYFYVLRPLLAVKWIQKYQTPPPMLFETLVEDVLEQDLKPIVTDLLEQKRTVTEKGETLPNAILQTYLEKNLQKCKEDIVFKETKKKQSYAVLNDMFLKVLHTIYEN